MDEYCCSVRFRGICLEGYWSRDQMPTISSKVNKNMSKVYIAKYPISNTYSSCNFIEMMRIYIGAERGHYDLHL